MKRFQAFLTEATRPSAALVKKSIRDGVIIQVDRGNGDLDDYDTELKQLPLKKIVTRERGKRYSLDPLIAAYKSDPGRVVPIAVEKRSDGKYLVLDGHHRVQAAKQAGLTDIWVVDFLRQHMRGSNTMCTCGHPRRFHNGMMLFDGPGDCAHYNCSCKQFTPKK